jgi:predicted dehydrogenase
VSIGVGVYGASTDNAGWAMKAHVPAIVAVPQFQLVAVGTSNPDSAAAAARSLGVQGYAEPQRLIEDPRVDLVVVAVKAPSHYTLVRAALEAHKTVLCEWPLGINLTEAEELTTLAKASGVRTAIGLQGRFSPAVQQARQLIDAGYVGRVLGTSLVGSGIAWSGVTDRAHRYLTDADSGVSVLSVPALHALDTMAYVTGEFATVCATAAVRWSEVRLLDSGETVRATAWDHVAVSSVLHSGTLASVFYRGGVSRGQNLYWEINGSEGDLIFSSNVGNLQVADLQLAGARAADTTLTSLASASESMTGNVCRLYEALARDIESGSHDVPDFGHALRRHRLLTTLQECIEHGGANVAP